MISIAYILAAALGFFAVAEFFVILMMISKFPWILKCMGASSLVMLCDADGTLTPTPAEKVVGVFRTKKDGSFTYERTDVLTCGKIPTIVAYKPIMRAIRLDIAGIFRKLKKLGVGSKRSYLEIVNATEMTPEEFRQQYEIQEQKYTPAIEEETVTDDGGDADYEKE